MALPLVFASRKFRLWKIGVHGVDKSVRFLAA